MSSEHLHVENRELITRPRRLRQSSALRRMVRETRLDPSNLIYPLFVQEGRGIRQPIPSMPGQYRYSVDQVVQEVEEIARLGIPAVILFGIPDVKDACGSENYNPHGVIPNAIRTIKDTVPELLVISDMCFCEYTDHGHCGMVNTPDHDHYHPELPNGYLLNDESLEMLARASVVHAQAGADIIAPSAMLDGMVRAIRSGLDGEGLEHVSIMSYAVKTASGFYNPFRHAADSAPSFGDRRQYQMDFANKREALREAALDAAEGADILMIKPALPNLDIVSAVHEAHLLPTAAYHVSGEYAMLHAAAAQGWLDLRRCALESLTSIKRAGADLIVTYFAKDAAIWLDSDG